MPSAAAHQPLEHAASGRTWRAALVLVGVWLALLALWLGLNAAEWIVVGLLLFTVPAALDFANARVATLRLDDTTVTWRSGRQSGDIALARIAKVRFETRLDLSVRVRLELETGRRITLPQDSLPPWQSLWDAFEARGIRTERHHFSLL